MATAKKPKTTYEVLSSINVNDKTEKKGNLTYLSWAWAWAEVKKHYPTLTRTIYKNEMGWNYHTDGRTAWVEVGVTIDGVEHIDNLPIMDFRNKSISADNVTSFEVNKTIQRSTTKALALHGLGLYIYAGEDLPEGEEQKPEPKKTTTTKQYILDIGDDNWSKVLLYVAKNKELGLEKIVNQLGRKYKLTTKVKKELNNVINK